MSNFKKTLPILSFLFSITFAFSQQFSTRVVESTILVKKGFSQQNNKETKGSPYINDNFSPATIKPLNKEYLVRYNAVDDEMEVKQNSEILVLNKNNKNYIIDFKTKNQKAFVLENSETNVTGFYFLVEETPKVSLYRKDIKQFQQGRKASHSSLEDTPSKYINKDSKYYLKIDNEGYVVYEIPSSRKKFIKFFKEENQDKIKKLIRNNKIKLSKEEDLKRLIHLLN